MDAADKPTSAAGRKALNDPRIHRYYVRLTSEQNERFLRMYEQSGMKNKADFICHRIFGYIPANGRRYAPLGATRFRSRRTGAFSHFLCARIGTYESTCPRSLFLPYIRHCAAMRIRM